MRSIFNPCWSTGDTPAFSLNCTIFLTLSRNKPHQNIPPRIFDESTSTLINESTELPPHAKFDTQHTYPRISINPSPPSPPKKANTVMRFFRCWRRGCVAFSLMALSWCGDRIKGLQLFRWSGSSMATWILVTRNGGSSTEGAPGKWCFTTGV